MTHLLRIACLLCAVMLLQELTSKAQSVIKIASQNHSLLIKSDGSLWVVGANLSGQLGDGTYAAVRQPKQIVAGNVTAVAVGIDRSFFLKSDGSLWAMGNSGGLGGLGDGTHGRTNRPVQIVSSGVTAISAGDNFTLFLKEDGSLWGFGENDFGEMGELPQFGNSVPKKILPGGVTAIAAGALHTLFIKSDGSLWGMGNNIYGQLGDGTKENTKQPKEISDAKVIAVAAGQHHSLFIKTDSSLWAMGLNNHGQVGDCTLHWIYQAKQVVSSNVTAVAGGRSASIFLKNDGSLWAMGFNLLNDFGAGIKVHSICPVQIAAGNSAQSAPLVAGYYYDAALKTTASLWAKNFNNYNQPNRGTVASIAKSHQAVANPPGNNVIVIEPMGDGNVRLTYFGNAGATYALDRSFSLTTPNWLPQVTNSTDVKGALIVTNSPNPAQNNFWRIRSVP